MDIQEFKSSILKDQIPTELSVQSKSLWYDGKGDWKKAHDLIDQLNDKHSAHIHAYLHRKEGDIWNADYWYTRAGQKRPNLTPEQEWEQLVTLYLNT
ncbi:MAG: hypothetical protein V4594_09900 [Bacteroidota bacterium]